jgi:hypothetical protein
MAKSAPEKMNRYPLSSPRFWHGMRFPYWCALLAQHRFRISFSRLHIALGVSFFTPITDLLALFQHLFFGRAIARTSLAGPPIFVLGHWRSGTTLLHEYLALDERFASPTTFQCFAPWHFLLTEGLVTRFGGFLLPERRPMDNMKAGWALPQEDEFALMNLGAPTPYLRILFPNDAIPFEDTLAAETFQPQHLELWKRLMDWFLRAVTYKSGKRLILKSPPHTGRLGILRTMYPDAKFVHIVRDPRKVYPSTMKLWKTLDQVQSVQSPTDVSRLKEFVLKALPAMYASFESDRSGMDSSQIIDVTYEQLVADPVGVVGRIYDQLQLGAFEPVRAKLVEKTQSERDYQTNKLELNPEEEKMILNAWQSYAVRYGYA